MAPVLGRVVQANPMRNKTMEYIVSRGFMLPQTAQEFRNDYNFNLWSKQFWPYGEIELGDIRYWYETPSKRIVWKTRIVKVEGFPYQNRRHLREMLVTRFGHYDEGTPYAVNAPEMGYCLAYKSDPLERLNIPKPDNFRFPQLGWLKINDEIVAQWLTA